MWILFWTQMKGCSHKDSIIRKMAFTSHLEALYIMIWTWLGIVKSNFLSCLASLAALAKIGIPTALFWEHHMMKPRTSGGPGQPFHSTCCNFFLFPCHSQTNICLPTNWTGASTIAFTRSPPFPTSGLTHPVY